MSKATQKLGHYKFFLLPHLTPFSSYSCAKTNIYLVLPFVQMLKIIRITCFPNNRPIIFVHFSPSPSHKQKICHCHNRENSCANWNVLREFSRSFPISIVIIIRGKEKMAYFVIQTDMLVFTCLQEETLLCEHSRRLNEWTRC